MPAKTVKKYRDITELDEFKMTNGLDLESRF